jgi:SAM-dependent methyltransferase
MLELIRRTVHKKRLLGDELAFWEGYVAKGLKHDRRFVFPALLMGYAAQVRASLGIADHEPVPVLEIGSGPLSHLAYGVEQKAIAVTAIDPLAPQYERLMARLGASWPIRPRLGYGEQVAREFPGQPFAIAYVCNALDHTLSPRACVENMAAVVRPGGFIYIEGFSREGTNEGWRGLHRFDLFPAKGRVLCQERRRAARDLTGGLPFECAEIRVATVAERFAGVETGRLQAEWFTAVFRVSGR